MDAGSGWTDDRVALLGKLWADGLSASQIAAALGGGVTRNAVIGKVHRLGLSGRKVGQPAQKVAGGKPRPPSPPQPVADAPRPNGSADLMPEAPEVRPAVLADRRWVGEPAIAVSERVSILDLRDTMCRWPLGDPTGADFGFCGARSVTGLPYCGAHCRIAYQPAAERKRIRA